MRVLGFSTRKECVDYICECLNSGSPELAAIVYDLTHLHYSEWRHDGEVNNIPVLLSLTDRAMDILRTTPCYYTHIPGDDQSAGNEAYVLESDADAAADELNYENSRVYADDISQSPGCFVTVASTFGDWPHDIWTNSKNVHGCQRILRVWN